MTKKFKSLAAIILTVAFLLSGYSFNSFAAPAKTAPKVVKQTNVFMWEVSPKDAKSTKKVYLLGSIHAGNKSNFPMDKRIEDSYKKSDALVVEADISKITQEMAMEYITKYGTYTGTDNLKKKISPELYKKLGEELQKMGIPMSPNIDAGKPWLIASQISSMRAVQSGYDASLGIDMYFMNKAKDKKPILELESADFQFQMLANLTDKQQEAFLKDSLNSKDYVKDAIDKIYKYWKIGDTKNLEALMFPKAEMTKDITDLYNILFYKRNIGMEKKIEEYLKDTKKNYFVVAGAGHMIGTKGVVSLLIAKGYKVKQM